MTKPTKKKAAMPRASKAGGEIEAKRAEAYLRMEPHLCDCQRWTELAEDLSLGNDEDRALYDMVVHHAAGEMKKLLAAYYALGGFEL
jgi:hypothetical protein